MRKLYTIIAIAVAGVVYGQNAMPHHMYLMNQGMLNPAYIGINDIANATLISRGQWVGIEGSPYMHSLIASSTISNHSAAGFSLVREGYGIHVDTEIKLNYSYRISYNDKVLSFGMHGGVMNLAEDFSKLDLEQSTDPFVRAGNPSRTRSTFGFGLMFKTDRFFAGVSAPRVTPLDQITNGVEIKGLSPEYNLTAGLFIDYVNGLMFKPSIMVAYIGEELVMDLNAQLLVGEKIWLGASYRNLGSGGVNIIYTEDRAYHFGYSFQFPFNELGTVGYGTHELMLSIDLDFGKRHILRHGRYF